MAANKQQLNGVYNYYGPRDRHEGVQGKTGTVDAEHTCVVLLSGGSYSTVSFTLPAGAVLHSNTIVEVEEAFALGGTAPVINIGVSGSEGTNRIAQVSEAQAEAVGVYSIAPAGTLAVNTPLASAVTVVVALGGTTPTITAAGKMKVVFSYRMV